MATLAEVLEDFEDNADYDSELDTTKALLFIAAARKLLVKMARDMQTGGAGGERISYNVQLIKDALDDAIAWVAAMGGQVVHPDLEDYRA